MKGVNLETVGNSLHTGIPEYYRIRTNFCEREIFEKCTYSTELRNFGLSAFDGIPRNFSCTKIVGHNYASIRVE